MFTLYYRYSASLHSVIEIRICGKTQVNNINIKYFQIMKEEQSTQTATLNLPNKYGLQNINSYVQYNIKYLKI